MSRGCTFAAVKKAEPKKVKCGVALSVSNVKSLDADAKRFLRKRSWLIDEIVRLYYLERTAKVAK